MARSASGSFTGAEEIIVTIAVFGHGIKIRFTVILGPQTVQIWSHVMNLATKYVRSYLAFTAT